MLDAIPKKKTSSRNIVSIRSFAIQVHLRDQLSRVLLWGSALSSKLGQHCDFPGGDESWPHLTAMAGNTPTLGKLVYKATLWFAYPKRSSARDIWFISRNEIFFGLIEKAVICMTDFDLSAEYYYKLLIQCENYVWQCEFRNYIKR